MSNKAEKASNQIAKLALLAKTIQEDEELEVSISIELLGTIEKIMHRLIPFLEDEPEQHEIDVSYLDEHGLKVEVLNGRNEWISVPRFQSVLDNADKFEKIRFLNQNGGLHLLDNKNNVFNITTSDGKTLVVEA